MSKPHKHAELIKAWADGATIEIRHFVKGWTPMIKEGEWFEHYEYRIKPEPKPVEIAWDLYCRIYILDNGDGTFEFLRAEKLKSAEVLK